MDGLLIVDKPTGPTSHEVVARVRRALGERRIGHTGTLDPAASGVLPLVLGRATRLARFLARADKSYHAMIRMRVATDTYDGEGTPTQPMYEGPLPSAEAIDFALDGFRGTFDQRPPAFSAKKIQGRRSYRLARAASRTAAGSQPPAGVAARPACVRVTTFAVDLLGVDGDLVTIRVDCSAGFYVRALAHDLGERLGVGAYLAALCRTVSGDARIENAVALDAIEREPALAATSIVPLSRMLPGLAAVTLTRDGVRHALHGRDVGPGDVEQGGGDVFRPDAVNSLPDSFFRLLDPGGELVAIATPTEASGLLHPAVVLS